MKRKASLSVALILKSPIVLLRLILSFSLFYLPLSFTSCSELLASTISVREPAIETGVWTNVEKVLKPMGGWGISMSSGIGMVYVSTPGGGNWCVRITTNVDFDNDGTPDPLIEGNEYEYNYLTYEGPNYYMEQTTKTRSVTIPDFDQADTNPILVVNDNFGFESPPPQSVTGFFTETSTNQFVITVTWSQPSFNTSKATSPTGPFTTVANLSIRDISLYQIWRSTIDADANSMPGYYTMKGNLLSTDPLQFIDNDNLLSGVTYYYALRSLDAYSPASASLFSVPMGVKISGGVSVAIRVELTVDMKALSGASNAVYVTLKVPEPLKTVLDKAPMASNGNGTWTLSVMDSALITGRSIHYRYSRDTAQGTETELDQSNTSSGEHEFQLDVNNPQVDIATVPYLLRIHDRWGIPTYDATPMGMPNVIAGMNISSGVFTINSSTHTGNEIEMRWNPEEAFVQKESEDGNPSAEPQTIYGGIRYLGCNNDVIPNGAVKVYYSTSTDLLAPFHEVAASSPTVPFVAFGNTVVKVFIEPPLACSFKVALVDANGQMVGNPSKSISNGEDVPKISEVGFVEGKVALEVRSGDKTGKIILLWNAPPKMAEYGSAHTYDIVYATFPIVNLATLKKAKFAGRFGASMPGSSESFAIGNLGDTAPGYYVATIPIYDDWSSTSGAKVTVSVAKIGVAPKALNLSSRKDSNSRIIVKGASGDNIDAMGFVSVSTTTGDSYKRASLEVPRGGLEMGQAMAVIKNAREIWNEAGTPLLIDKANQEAKTTTRRIAGAISALNLVSADVRDSSIVSYEISDLSGNNYFDSDKKTAKLPLKISVPIPGTWDANRNGIVDVTEGTDKPVRVADLRVYRLNTKGNFWEMVNEGDHSIDIANGTVHAEVKHLSTFALFAPGGAAKDLRDMVIYPNPFVPFDDNCENGFPYGESCGGLFQERSGIAFDNMTENSEIFIYTLSMDLVRRHKLTGASIEEKNGKWRWDAKNDSGDSVASGLYIYMVKDENAAGVTKKTGKLVIIR